MRNQTVGLMSIDSVTGSDNAIENNNDNDISGDSQTAKPTVSNNTMPKINLESTFSHLFWSKVLANNLAHNNLLRLTTEYGRIGNTIQTSETKSSKNLIEKINDGNDNFSHIENTVKSTPSRINTVNANGSNVLLFYSLLQQQIQHQILQQNQKHFTQQNPSITVNNNNNYQPSTENARTQIGSQTLANLPNPVKTTVVTNTLNSLQIACLLRQYYQQNLPQQYVQQPNSQSVMPNQRDNNNWITVDRICDNLQQRIQCNTISDHMTVGTNSENDEKTVLKKRKLQSSPKSPSSPSNSNQSLLEFTMITNFESEKNKRNVKWHSKSRELWRKWSLESSAENDLPKLSSSSVDKCAAASDKLNQLNVIQEVDKNSCDLKNDSNDKVNDGAGGIGVGFECARCGKMFSYAYYRDKHLKYTRCVDNGDRKFPCALCSRSFEKRDRLRIHVLHVHENHRPHVCATCGKAFSQSSSLNKHLRVHSGERPYHCPFCTKCFTASSILRTHIRQHSGEKPFKCVFCGKSFASHAAHDSHVRRTHSSPAHSTVNHSSIFTVSGTPHMKMVKSP